MNTQKKKLLSSGRLCGAADPEGKLVVGSAFPLGKTLESPSPASAPKVQNVNQPTSHEQRQHHSSDGKFTKPRPTAL